MTKLEVAFAEAAKLPQTEQESLAGWILEEISSQKRWDEIFARFPDELGRLADEAMAEHRAGKTLPLDLDES
jgi:hypothetical protein